jgi:hypothetical protein
MSLGKQAPSLAETRHQSKIRFSVLLEQIVSDFCINLGRTRPEDQQLTLIGPA